MSLQQQQIKRAVKDALNDYSTFDNGINLLSHAVLQSTGSASKKRKSLVKFGRNPNVQTTASTLWWSGQDLADSNENYVSTNIIDTISSADAGDTQNVKVEGHIFDGEGKLHFRIQSATLNGQNKVTLSTPLARLTRLYNDDNTDFAGEIYGYEDTAITSGKPTDVSKIHITVPVGYNQSLKASTSISNTDYWIITNVYAHLETKSTNNFAEIDLQFRDLDKVFRTIFTFAISSQNSFSTGAIPPFVVNPNSDVRLVARASTNGLDVSGGIGGILTTTL